MPSKKKILVTGSNGQLGSELKDLAVGYPDYEFIFLTRAELSLSDAESIEKIIAQHRPHYLINCAAYTAVDKAESEKEEAFQINAIAVGLLAAACHKNAINFIHISTDYVFDGSQKEPLKENERTHPVNIYGESKLAGEQAAFRHNPDSVIIRTSWVYSYHGKNFVKTMMRLMAEKESISVVGDQFGSPTYAADLAKAIMQIIAGDNWTSGIYHFSNEGTISWADFAQEIGHLIQSKCKVIAIPTASYPTPAKRPLFSVMDKTKIQLTFGVELKSWKESLGACVQKLQS